MKWYKEWFNCKYYHILYKNRDFKEAKEFIDNICKEMTFDKDSIALEVGCGKGRHAYYISKHIKVIGIDLSDQSIKYAKRFENENLKFKIYDMKKVYKHNYFDYVFNIFTSFGYFSQEENKQVLHNINRSLKKDGVLILDFINCNKAIQNLKENERVYLDDIIFNIKRYTYNNYIVKEIDIIDNDIKLSFKENVEIIGIKEFESYFCNLNMKIINIFGDYKLNNFDKNKSDRLIIIAKK